MVSIARALRQIKDDLDHVFDARQIKQACYQVGYQWRRGKLGPVATVRWILIQVLFGNTACVHISQLADRDFSGTAFCQARRRLPVRILETLLRSLTDAAVTSTKSTASWHGHRTFLIDGSSCSMPDTPELVKHFGYVTARQRRGQFLTAHLLAMFDVATGLLLSLTASLCRTHDLRPACDTYPSLQPGDLVVGDRAFGAFVSLSLLLKDQIQGVFRLHQATNVSFKYRRSYCHPRKKLVKGMPRTRWIKRLGQNDQLVEYFKPKGQSKAMSVEVFDGLPDSIVVREMKYHQKRRGFRTRTVILVTTLINADQYPAADLKALYRRRWEVETNIGHLKTTLSMDVLKCKSVEGIQKELIAFAMIYNAVRMIMNEAAGQRGISLQRVSFIDALRWLQCGANMSTLMFIMLVPHRPGRIEPRAVKRRPKPFKFLTESRSNARKSLRGKKHTR